MAHGHVWPAFVWPWSQEWHLYVFKELQRTQAERKNTEHGPCVGPDGLQDCWPRAEGSQVAASCNECPGQLQRPPCRLVQVTQNGWNHARAVACDCLPGRSGKRPCREVRMWQRRGSEERHFAGLGGARGVNKTTGQTLILSADGACVHSQDNR